MTEQKPQKQDKPIKGEDDREARLAEALRENLRRRKAAARKAKAASEE